MSTQPRPKHLGEMVGEYRDYYNDVLKGPDDKPMTWLSIAKRGGFSDGHMANIHNNRAGRSRKTGEWLEFTAIPLKMVDMVVKGVANDELRPWFHAASNVDSPDDVKAEQFAIEQDLRTRGILPAEPRRRSHQAPAVSKPASKKASPQKRPRGRPKTGNALSVPQKDKGLTVTPVPPVASSRPLAITPDGTTISLHGLKMETHSMRLSVETIQIEGSSVQAALGLLFNIGGNKTE